MSKENTKMKPRTLMSSVVLAVACVLLSASSALAAAPEFKVTAVSNPTNFVAGSEPVKSGVPSIPMPQYTAIATNVGSAPTSGPITMSVTLPPGLTATSAPTAPVANDSKAEASTEFEELPCSISGQTVTCTDPRSLRQDQFMQIFVPVKVSASALGSVSGQITVEGGGAAQVSTSVTSMVTAAGELPLFDFLPGPNGFSAAATALDGSPAIQAGSHPYQLTFDLGFPSREHFDAPSGVQALVSVGHTKDVSVTLPRGMVVNPNVTPVRCNEIELNAEGGATCPLASQVGTVYVETSLEKGYQPIPTALYNMVPPPGAAAEFGFNAVNVGIFVHLLGRVNSAGQYELAADTPNILARPFDPVLGSQVHLWGNPSDAAHDYMRGQPCSGFAGCVVTVERRDAPFLTMPSSCRSALTATGEVDSWEDPTTKMGRFTNFEDPADGAATPTVGCNAVEFEPQVSAKPTTNLSDAPTGLEFSLHVPQTEHIGELATANFKDVSVAFPSGFAVNPAGANGLAACTPAQFGLTSGVGKLPVRTDANPARCPDDAKIGSVEVSTPLLDHPLDGAIYVAQPYQNPFGSLLAVYIAVEDEASGVVSKLAGRVLADPATGQLTTIFADNPELPIEDVKLKLFGGPRAALKTPLPCGEHPVATTITPWSTPEGADAQLVDSFAISVAAAGSGACPASEAAAPAAAGFGAGAVAPQAGAYSPFVLKLSRPDGTQRLTGIDTTLPKGLLAKLAGVSYCSEAQIAVAKGREAPNLGALERANPSCPLSSQVGTVTVGAGAGIAPIYVSGHAYLAGSYKGAPLSLVAITPAVAGPYDLGSVVVRTALRFNAESAQVRAVSDPLPTIREGIPLDLRSIDLRMDRPQFTLNPTSCNPTSVTGLASLATGQSAALLSRFQVGGCSGLKFAPKLALSLKGGTKRDKNPALKAVLTYPKGSYANIAYSQVTLPHSAFLDQSHIKTICTRVQFAADACPKGSIYGFAKATTPLLDEPLEGPVYLRASSNTLPDLVVALRGQIEVDLVGRIDTGKGGGIRNTFEAVPDAPVSKFVLELKGGKQGLLVNSENICKKPQRAIVDFEAQNGKAYDTTPLIRNSCKNAKKPASKKRHGARR
jgi:hypothetical protein